MWNILGSNMFETREKKETYISICSQQRQPNVLLDYVTWNVFFHFDLQKLSSYYAQFYSDESVNNMIISPPWQLLMGQGVSITFNSNKGQKR